MNFRPQFNQHQPGLITGYTREEPDLEELMSEHGDLEGVLEALLEREGETGSPIA